MYGQSCTPYTIIAGAWADRPPIPRRERYLASVGLNIYDGSVWQMASYLTGNVAPTTEYLTDVLLDAKVGLFFLGGGCCVVVALPLRRWR